MRTLDRIIVGFLILIVISAIFLLGIRFGEDSVSIRYVDEKGKTYTNKIGFTIVNTKDYIGDNCQKLYTKTDTIKITLIKPIK